MANEPVSDQMARELREAWFRYLDTIEAIRPALYRYCRRMTGEIWETQDLLQETLLKGFGGIGRGECGQAGSQVKDPRAYLFRIATNLWIDQLRRSQMRFEAATLEPSLSPEQAVAAREAVAVLLSNAAPYERAALVLKDVFDFSLEEIAQMLSTTIGAIKSALHRDRASMEEPNFTRRAKFRAPSKELLDRFVDAFNARDINRVTQLLLENVTIEVPGVGGGPDRNFIWARSSMELPTPNNPVREQSAMNPEVIRYQDEWIMVTWVGPRSDAILADINRFEEEDGRIARVWEYHYCPEAIAEIAADLGAMPSQHGYHQPADILSRMIASAVLPWESA